MPIPLKLTVYKGSDLVGEHRFERDIVKIGRLASAHLKLDDAKVSRIHAVIEATSNGGEYSIIDMGSTEGTFVNGERVSKEKLSDGDEIRLGDCRLLVSLEDAEVRVPGKDASASAAMTRSVSAESLPPVPRPVEPAELWAASSQDLATAQPTMSLSPASESADLAAPESPEAGRLSSFVGPAVAVPSHSTPSAKPVSAIVQLQAQAGGGVAVVSNKPRKAQPRPASMPPAPPPATQRAAPAQGHGSKANQDVALVSAWGTVPNNLASEGVSENERALEIKLIWRGTVIDTFSTVDQRAVTLGDERKTSGFGPFQKLIRCDIEAPSKGLPAMTYTLAAAQSATGCSYAINIPGTFRGRLEKADGTVLSLDELLRRDKNPVDGTHSLNAAETLFLEFGELTLQIRYVRHAKLVPPPFWSDLNYSWVNMLILAFFIHTMAIVSFIATPVTQAELTEDIFKNPNRFAQFRLTPEEKKKQQNDFLKKLKDSAGGAKAKGEDGKAGKKDHPKDKKQGRMAVKAVDPNDKEVAKSTLAKLFGAKGNTGRSYLFGSGGLGGELKGALGGVTGAEIGDASGLGGLGTRGSGPGGGGLSMNSVGLGALGTAGRGGGGNGYGDGVGGLGKKSERDIEISQGAPVIQGSLDKELIRRVIREHMPQIRYCYEKELSRSPGLFGKIATEFTISASGSVEAASIAQSTMNNGEVERCIASKIRTWVFPKPKGGGVVLVKYPFIFKTSG